MTTSEADRVLKALTEFRVDSAGRFATLEEQIRTLAGLPVAIEKLSGRVTALELQGASSGKFSWSDVFKVISAVAALAAIIGVGISVFGG